MEKDRQIRLPDPAEADQAGQQEPERGSSEQSRLQPHCGGGL
jgi:hypothetical protein